MTYSLMLRLEDRDCVVGGSTVAVPKVAALLKARARVTVLSLRLPAQIEGVADAPDLSDFESPAAARRGRLGAGAARQLPAEPNTFERAIARQMGNYRRLAGWSTEQQAQIIGIALDRLSGEK
jgi:siroheme synthase (precorrin-2 oxidase/ferrochelatase)